MHTLPARRFYLQRTTIKEMKQVGYMCVLVIPLSASKQASAT